MAQRKYEGGHREQPDITRPIYGKIWWLPGGENPNEVPPEPEEERLEFSGDLGAPSPRRLRELREWAESGYDGPAPALQPESKQ